MSLSIWDLFKYLFKWKWLIAGFTVVCLILATYYVDRSQTYSAKVIIQYNDGCIGQGKTLDGEAFDPNEIKSPTVILNVLKDMGRENSKIDSVRERISITSVTPTTVGNLKTAKEKMGEEYQYFPRTFVITYKGNSSFEDTRDLLSSVVANYFKYYSEQYLYLATLNEVDYELNQKSFDYIEQIEQIEENMDQTIKALSGYSKDSTGYRSPSTGLTFEDLLKEFERVREYSVSEITARIFNERITRNRSLLLDKYTERKEADEREVHNLEYKAKLAKSRMDAYVEANRNVPHAYGDGENGSDINILQDVEWDRDSYIEEQTVYDNLVISYANDSIAANDKRLEAEYCQDVLDCFRDGEARSNPATEAEIQTEIQNVLTTLSELYQKANININDYNAYIPALHIKKLSGVGYYENMSGSLYKLIALLFGFGFSAVLAIGYEVIKRYAKDSFHHHHDEKPEGEEPEAGGE